MNLYKHIDYRKALRELIDSRKKIDPSWTYQRASEVMRIQKSYLSQVLNNGKAEINSDQLYLLLKHLEVAREEVEYFFLLLEYSRSSLQERRQELKTQIDSIRAKKNDSEAYLKVQSVSNQSLGGSEYYLDSYNQLVHVCLSNEAFRSDPYALADRLGIQKARLQEILLELQRLQLIAVDKEEITVLKKNIHLSKTSKMFAPWKIQMRQMALQRSLQTRSEENYNFSVIFSCTEEVRKELQEDFFKFIQKAQSQVNKSPPERVFQMNFDLLSWL